MSPARPARTARACRTSRRKFSSAAEPTNPFLFTKSRRENCRAFRTLLRNFAGDPRSANSPTSTSRTMDCRTNSSRDPSERGISLRPLRVPRKLTYPNILAPCPLVLQQSPPRRNFLSRNAGHIENDAGLPRLLATPETNRRRSRKTSHENNSPQFGGKRENNLHER